MSISAQPYKPFGSTPLAQSFLSAAGIEDENLNHVDTQGDIFHETTDSDVGETGDLTCTPENHRGWIKTLSYIEDLINMHDFVGAAEEILKLNIGTIPQNLFERYSNALETTAENLSLKDTYLNSQLAAQSLVVIGVQDELQINGVLFVLGEADDSQTMACLGLSALENDVPAFILNWDIDDDGMGMSDEHNPQLSPNTAILARFMKQQTEGAHQQASIDHGGAYGQHVYALDMKIPGQF